MASGMPGSEPRGLAVVRQGAGNNTPGDLCLRRKFHLLKAVSAEDKETSVLEYYDLGSEIKNVSLARFPLKYGSLSSA